MKIWQTLEVSHDTAITYVTINRPKQLNALNAQVLLELDQVVTELSNQNTCRVMVLTGAGDKAFVAGADIAAMKAMTPQEALQFARQGQLLSAKLTQAPWVNIAKVNGFALGGGCELAMACDIIIAAETAQFGQPEVDLGLIPGFGGTQRLIKRVGPTMAMAMLVGGTKISGKEAVQYGLASQAVPREELDQAVTKAINGVLRAAPRAIAATKRLTYAAQDWDMNNGLMAEAEAFALRFQDPEASDGMGGFLEKRRPFFFSGV
jgi:enoyl-CoA hydratase